MGRYLDGRVSAVLGTHTHVPTADEEIFPRGTAFQCDVGMTGPYHSILGREIDRVMETTLTFNPTQFDVADGRRAAVRLDRRRRFRDRPGDGDSPIARRYGRGGEDRLRASNARALGRSSADLAAEFALRRAVPAAIAANCSCARFAALRVPFAEASAVGRAARMVSPPPVAARPSPLASRTQHVASPFGRRRLDSPSQRRCCWRSARCFAAARKLLLTGTYLIKGMETPGRVRRS